MEAIFQEKAEFLCDKPRIPNWSRFLLVLIQKQVESSVNI